VSETFDRMRARTHPVGSSSSVDVQGKAALFSDAASAPSLGSVSVSCSRCHTATTVSYARAVRLSVPGVYLPLRREYPMWMRCPACDERRWVKVRFR
jgi:hypothetical protein